jgi:hypothetical protein
MSHYTRKGVLTRAIGHAGIRRKDEMFCSEDTYRKDGLRITKKMRNGAFK